MDSETTIIESLLGKRIVLYMLLVGLIPLIVFTVPMYFQSYDVMRREAKQSLENYSQLASGQLFQTLKQGEHRLVRLVENHKSPPEDTQAYFSTLTKVDGPDGLKEILPLPDSWPVESALDKLKSNNPQSVHITPAYTVDDYTTVSMITMAPDGSIWVGEIHPAVLWQTLRGSLFGERDLAVVLDDRGRILASSRGLFEPFVPVEKYFSGVIPESGMGHGVHTLKKFGRTLWISKQLWLEGAFGTGEWKLVMFRSHGAVQSLPLSLLESLAIWLLLALAGLILISFRFARQLYNPINKLSQATHELAAGNWSAEVSVETGDELEALAHNFNDMRDTIKETNEQLKHDATHDRLTGLPNRVLLEDRIQHKIDFARRNSDYGFAVVFLDLDRFKVVNDSLGHNAGDELLKKVANRLKDHIRSTDMLVRLGGDEFVVVLDSVLNVEKAVQAVESFESVLDQPFEVRDQEVFVGASMGIVFYREQYTNAEQMLRDADTAMYRAKKQDTSGSSYVVFGQIMRDQAQHRLDLETDIQAAVKEGQFELRYQPILDLKTGQTRGCEALIRWKHPEKGWISPGQFIPLAEEIGSIKAIGQWVLEESIQKLETWTQRHGTKAGWVSINLSPKQLFDDTLIEEIERLLNEHEFDPSNLKLEVTENALISSTDHAVNVLKHLRDLGFQVCMDDFGTGHSSLSLLQELPIDVLKIDREFVANLQERDDQRAIIAAVVGLAGEMNMNVVAEGIETEAELEKLKTMDCKLGQGYLFAYPMRENNYEIYLQKVNRISMSRDGQGLSTVIQQPDEETKPSV